MTYHLVPRSALLVAAGLLLSSPGGGAAQRVHEDASLVPADPARTAEPGAGRAFVFSAVLPGAGQRELGSVRWIPYAAFEAVGWLRFLDRRSEGRELEQRYRDLAWTVARRIGTAPRRDGGFGYYEAMAKFDASGGYDLDSARPGIQPERDESTYNGAVWALARALYFPAETDSLPPSAPEYEQALGYYRQRAVGPDFAWAWGEHGVEQRAYRELMHGSDEALRSATRTLGLILANHLVSAVDALVTARLTGGERGAPPPARFESGVALQGDAPAWTVAVRLFWPGR